MTTISIPLPEDLLLFIDKIILSGEVENRAQAVRRAVRKMRENMEIQEILEASKQIDDGIFYSGNIKDIVKKRKNA